MQSNKKGKGGVKLAVRQGREEGRGRREKTFRTCREGKDHGPVSSKAPGKPWRLVSGEEERGDDFPTANRTNHPKGTPLGKRGHKEERNRRITLYLSTVKGGGRLD